jgi:hypothetical protein
MIFLVGPDDPALAATEGMVRQDPGALRSDRPTVAHHAARGLLEPRLGNELEELGAEVVLDLDLVPFSVAADEDHDRTEVGVEDEGLDELRGRLAEEPADVVDGLRTGCVQLGDGLGRRGLDFVVEEPRGGLLHVRPVAAVRAAHHGVLARLRQDHELVRGRSADVPGIRFDRDVV